MDAIELLKAHHEEVNALLEQIDQAEVSDKAPLFAELAANLAAHIIIEESHFYPAAYAKQTRDLLYEAVEEHLAIKRLLADLLGMNPRHDNFAPKIKVLAEQIKHHVKEEEHELFPAVRKGMSAGELERLGTVMKERFDREMDGEPTDGLSDQLDEAASLA